MDEQRVHSRSMDPPMLACPECFGRGSVSRERAAEMEGEERSIDDYASEWEADAAEHRWEWENER